jgi:hypothetical protein
MYSTVMQAKFNSQRDTSSGFNMVELEIGKIYLNYEKFQANFDSGQFFNVTPKNHSMHVV